MKGFKITAVTEAGKEALQEQLRARHKQPLHARMMMKRFMGVSHDEESMTIQFKDKVLGAIIQPEDIKAKILQGMRESGAEEERDFIVEVY